MTTAMSGGICSSLMRAEGTMDGHRQGAGNRNGCFIAGVTGPSVPVPDIAAPPGVEAHDMPVIAAMRIVDSDEPVADYHYVVGRRAARVLAAVDGIAAARQQVVLDNPVGLNAEILEQPDRVGLAAVDEDGIVPHRQECRFPAVGGDPIDMVTLAEARVMDVAVLDEPRLHLYARGGMPDVVAQDSRAGAVTIDVLYPDH